MQLRDKTGKFAKGGKRVTKSKEGPFDKLKSEVAAKMDARKNVNIELGGGESPNEGFFNIDILPFQQVDLVWDIERTPWPIPSESAQRVVCSHLLEHISPGWGDKRLPGLVELLVAKGVIKQDEADEYMGLPGAAFMNVMNEVWRVLKPQGQFAFVVPYAESHGMFQDPTHQNFINETTMLYFDPLDESGFYGFYKPKPWKIERQYVQRTGLLEVLLRKRPEDEAFTEPERPKSIVNDVAKEVRTVRMK